MKVVLIKSPKSEKKWRVLFENGKHIDFGQKGYSDFTKHKNPARMKLYLQRHKRMGETWTTKGLYSAGFWARWLLWSKPELTNAKKLIQNKFGIKFVRVL
jgi:hypothetical protein